MPSPDSVRSAAVPLRSLLATLACLLVVAACAADADPVDGAGDASATTASEGVVVEDPVGDEQQPATGGDVPATTGGAAASPRTSPSTDAGAVESSTTTAPPVATPSPAPGPVGAYAGFYLRPGESAAVLVQVLAQDGAAPRPETLDHVAAVLGRVSGKAVSVTTGGVDGGARQWRSEDLRALADAAGTAQSPDQAVLTLLFLGGGSADNERAVGIAVRSDVAAVFADRVDEAAGVLGSRAAVEDAVTLHEVGHLLGLVDLVLDTGREDPEHPGHSPNRDSVMYHAVESTLLGTLLSGGPPRDFDQADLDDLARIRGG